MTIKTITFQQTFPTGMYANQKLGIEIELEPGDHPLCKTYGELINQTFADAKKYVNDAFHAMNPQSNIFDRIINEQPIDQPIPTIDRAFEREKENTEIAMDNATTQDELTTLWDKAVEYHLTDHYEKRLKELS